MRSAKVLPRTNGERSRCCEVAITITRARRLMRTATSRAKQDAAPRRANGPRSGVLEDFGAALSFWEGSRRSTLCVHSRRHGFVFIATLPDPGDVGASRYVDQAAILYLSQRRRDTAVRLREPDQPGKRSRNHLPARRRIRTAKSGMRPARVGPSNEGDSTGPIR